MRIHAVQPGVLPVAVLGGLVAAGVASVAAGNWAGALTRAVAWTSLGAGALAGLAILLGTGGRRTPGGRTVRLGFWDLAALGAFAFFAWRSFLWLANDTGEYLTVGNSYNHGDLALHLAFIRHMASGAEFWPTHPLLDMPKLAYPLGTDLLNALLVLAGLPLLESLAWVGLVCSALTAAMLWRWGGAFAVATFLFVGGIAWPLVDPARGVVDLMADSAWKSLPLALFVTQRGLLVAIPAGLALLWSWRTRCAGGAARPLPPAVELLLYASLPLFHLHSFLFISLALAALALAAPPARRHHFLLLTLAAVVPASLLVFQVIDLANQPAGLGPEPGWMQDDENPLLFWAGNFGLWLPLLALAPVLLLGGSRTPARRADLALALTAAGVFLACTQIRFAPWAWDNTKLMLWSFLTAAPIIQREILHPIRPSLRVICCVLLFPCGALSLAGGLRPREDPVRIIERAEINHATPLLRAIPADARVAAAPDWNHPVILAGHRMALGYEGHVWSHGYDSATLRQSLDALMRGGPAWRRHADRLGATHIYWGAREQRTFGAGAKAWMDHTLVAASAPGHGVLYVILPPPR